MYKRVKKILDDVLGNDVVLEVPKDFSRGHFATTIAFTLAKQQKRSPKEIAKEIIAKLDNIEEFSKVEEVNCFINITLSDCYLAAITQEILDVKYPQYSNNGVKILLEYVSANPTGPLHIGHARGAIFGDTLQRVGKYLGYDVVSEYYVNDAGSQIDMLGLSILLFGKEILGYSVEFPEVYYRGEYIIDVAKEALEVLGEDVFRQDNIKALSEFGLEKMIALIKNNLQSANITFDSFVSEKDLFSEFEVVKNILINNNATYEKDSKLWLKSSLKGDEKDRVIVRDNGEPTYLAGDIIYHNDKFARGYDKYINILGADHHGYIARIKASIDFLGYDSSKLEVLLSQMVNLLKGGEPYKMSKRAGNFILMQDVIDDVGADILRFVFLTKKSDTHLEFDIDVFKEQDSNNPLYYINYANARIHTVLGKSNAESNFNFTPLQDEWKDLLITSLLLNRVLEGAFEDRAMQKIPEYLKNLASKFHYCYNSFRIIDNTNEGAILSILQSVSLSITKALSLMGITAKTKM